MNPFIFMMCTERSGSNFLARLMNGHSEVSGPSPSHLFRLLNDNLCRYGDLSNDNNWHDFLIDIVALLDSNLGGWNSNVSFSILNSEVKNRDLQSVLAYIYVREAQANGKKYSYIKENHVYRYYPFINEFFNKPKFIYLVRDPRDMALSWKKAPNGRGCVVRAANIWKQDQVAGLLLFSALNPVGRIHSVRYEDLVRNPEVYLSRACRFLELDFESSMIELDKQAENDSYSKMTPEWKNVKKPVMHNNFNKFMRELSRDEISYVELLCRDEMLAFGYELIYTSNISQDDRKNMLPELESLLMPYEENEKKIYQEQSDEIKNRHAQRVNTLKNITAREFKPFTW